MKGPKPVFPDKMVADVMNSLGKIKTLASNRYAVPVVFLIVAVLTYGLSFWRLGFYWDDLPISWIRYQLGPEATTKYFSDSRPVWGLLYQLTGYLLPQKPAYWQLFAIFWRWAGVLTVWLVLERLFPERKDITFLLSLFVLLYPGFNQQWVSYLYSHFFIVLFFLLFSWYLMLRKKTALAMLFSALNLLMLEYFFLLEFVRPLIIFRSLQEKSMTERERYLKTFKLWLPYIGVIFLVVLYRLFVFSHPGFGYSLTEELVRNPLGTTAQLVRQILFSLWTTTVAAWLQVFQFPVPNVDGWRTTAFYAIVVLAVFALVFIYNRLRDSQKEPTTNRFALLLVCIGVMLLVLGGIPFWVTNLPVTLGFPANRATLSFMFGACFFLIGLIEFLPVQVKNLAAVLLISLAAGRQFLWSIDYARDWQSQKNLFWQMSWRAPGLEPGTLVLMNEELKYYADNSIGAALNWIYAPDNRTDRLDYLLYYPKNRLDGSLPGFEPGLPVRYDDFLVGYFEGSTSQVVVFYYSPPGCLRLLDPEIDPSNRLIPADTLLREVARLSSTKLILDKSSAQMPDIYNPEPEHSWCYYFEKADLARQLGGWKQIVELGDQAFNLDDYPNDPLERFVFVEGYAHVGKWEKAIEYSQVSYKVSKNFVGPLLCRLWERIDREVPASPEKNDFVIQAKTLFVCNP